MKTETAKNYAYRLVQDELARVAIEVARTAGRRYRLQPDDCGELCSRLFLRLTEKLNKYDARWGSLDAWAYGHAKWIIRELRREAHRLDRRALMGIVDNTERPLYGLSADEDLLAWESRQIWNTWEVDPDANTADQIEALRPWWQRGHERHLASAREATAEGCFEDAEREAQHVALLDILLGIPTEELVPIWETLMMGRDHLSVAREHGMKRNTLDQKLSRFRRDVRSRRRDLVLELMRTVAHPARA